MDYLLELEYLSKIFIISQVNQKKEQKLLLMHVHFTKIQRKLLKSVKTYLYQWLVYLMRGKNIIMYRQNYEL